MFGGIGITSYRAKNALIDGLSKGQGLAKIAGGLLNEALGISNFVNTVTCYIIDAQTGIEMQLPVNPEKITVKWGRKTETVNILNLGEVDFTTGDKLTEVSFESFFPQEYVPTYCVTATPPTPTSANAVMNSWKSRFQEPIQGLKEPIQLIVTGAQDINMNCLLTSYESSEKGGEPGDIYYSATFREWREIYVRKESEESPKSRVNLKPRPRLVKVPTVAGGIFGSQEGFWKIAKEHYGNGESWKRVAQKNAAGAIRGMLKL